MTLIRIDIPEIEATVPFLQNSADTIGDIAAAARSACATDALPQAAAAQVMAASTAVDTALKDARTVALLLAVDLAARGILAIKGSIVAATSTDPTVIATAGHNNPVVTAPLPPRSTTSATIPVNAPIRDLRYPGAPDDLIIGNMLTLGIMGRSASFPTPRIAGL